MGLTKDGPTTANRSGRRIPGGLASVTVSDMPTSTVIDYDRTYLCGRGVLRFKGERVTVGQPLTADQLRSIARPEGFLSTGRIYPAPAGWAPPETAVAPVEPPAIPPLTAAESQALGASAPSPLTPLEQEVAAQTFVAAPDAQPGGEVIPATNSPESPVAAVEPVPAPEVADLIPATEAPAHAQDGADEGDGWQDHEDVEDVDDPFTT